jgi:hypothetical protein
MHRSGDSIDESSRLKQFAWEQWDDQIIAVIFRYVKDFNIPNQSIRYLNLSFVFFILRPGNYGLDRYVVKRYIEQVLFQSDRWKQLSFYFSKISPLVRAYSLTSHEVELMRRILDYHLNDKLRLRITQSNDQLIEYEDLLDFISRTQEFYYKNPLPHHTMKSINGKKSSIPSIPSIHSSFILPSLTKSIISPQSQSTPIKHSPPLPPSSLSQSNITQTSTNGHSISTKSSLSNPSVFYSITSQNSKIDGNGWVQINNVYLPFIIKNYQRLVPYPVLVSCKILEPNELQSTLTTATSSDVLLINTMIRDCQINNEQIPEKTLLINVYHVLIGTKNLVYVKILPKDSPTSKINRQYKSVLALRGGFLTITTRTIPFVCSSNHSYIPLNDILNIYPNLHHQLRGLARVPRTNEFDYLQLVQMYSNEKELPIDTLLINMEDLNQRQIIPSQSLTLIEYQTKERIKLEEQINLLNKTLTNKRKNSESHDNQQRFKNHWLSATHGHRGRTRWQ